MHKNILIIGATGEIGKATAEYLQECKYNCIILDQNEKALAELSKKYAIISIKYDLNDLENIKTIFEQISDKNIKLDGMVHCAGISPLMKVADNDIETMKKTFNINLFSFIELAKYFIQEKISNDNSSIVAISSITSSMAFNRQSIYASSKAALEESMRCMAKEFMERKTRVNCIRPSVVNGKMLEGLKKQSNNLEEKLKQKYPLGIIDAKYVSYLAEYLLSEKSKYITGSCIDMDSGYYSWL